MLHRLMENKAVDAPPPGPTLTPEEREQLAIAEADLGLRVATREAARKRHGHQSAEAVTASAEVRQSEHRLAVLEVRLLDRVRRDTLVPVELRRD